MLQVHDHCSYPQDQTGKHDKRRPTQHLLNHANILTRMRRPNEILLLKLGKNNFLAIVYQLNIKIAKVIIENELTLTL